MSIKEHFYHVTKGYVNLLEQKKVFTYEKLTRTGLFWNTNMAAVLLFWESNIIVFVTTHPNLVFLWHKGRNFQAIAGDCKLAASIYFIRGVSAGKLDFFRLDVVSVSDERGSVINDYL